MGCGASTPATVEGRSGPSARKTSRDDYYIGDNYKKLKHLGALRGGIDLQ